MPNGLTFKLYEIFKIYAYAKKILVVKFHENGLTIREKLNFVLNNTPPSNEL